jgi:hypothetical protein
LLLQRFWVNPQRMTYKYWDNNHQQKSDIGWTLSSRNSESVVNLPFFRTLIWVTHVLCSWRWWIVFIFVWESCLDPTAKPHFGLPNSLEIIWRWRNFLLPFKRNNNEIEIMIIWIFLSIFKIFGKKLMEKRKSDRLPKTTKFRWRTGSLNFEKQAFIQERKGLSCCLCQYLGNQLEKWGQMLRV